MKKFNPKCSINARSAAESRYYIPSTEIPLAESKNYIDKDGKNPGIGTAIHTKNIVFSREELEEGKWMLTYTDPKIVEESQKKFRELLRHSIWVVIQSQEEMQKIKEQEKKKWEEDEKERHYRSDHSEFNCPDPLKISPSLIMAKYQSVEEFKIAHPYYGGELTDRFKHGDEIWHYNERVIKRTFGQFFEFLLLIRNNTIIYSPLIGGEYRDGIF
jgi:hypothetical protein